MSGHHHHLLERGEAAERVTLVGAAVNLILTLIKIIVGTWANSHSLIADGVHSLSDLLSDAVVWFAARHAATVPDKEHPYGHGRFETLATLFLGSFLLLLAILIAWDAVIRLFEPEELITPGVLAIYAAAISILAKELLYHYTIKVAKQTKSRMLMANAWHHRSDAVSSIVVLVGVAGAMAGLDYLDAIAAVVVAVMIGKIGFELGWEAMHELADKGLQADRVAEIKSWIIGVGGVRDIHMLRTRSLGGAASVDVHVLVEPRISVSEGHLISALVAAGLKDEFEEVMDVIVHIDPEDDETAVDSPELPQRREIESELKSRCQDVIKDISGNDLMLHYLDGKVDIDWLIRDPDIQVSQLREKLHGLDYIGTTRFIRTI